MAIINGIDWRIGAGGTPTTLKLLQSLWKKAKTRRVAGKKHAGILAMEALEKSSKKIIIEVVSKPKGINVTKRNCPNFSQTLSTPEFQAKMRGCVNLAGPNGTGLSATINLDPKDKSLLLGTNIRKDPESQLVHEAYHAYRISIGKRCSNKQCVEQIASCIENWHRLARNLEQRPSYGKWKVKIHSIKDNPLTSCVNPKPK